MGTPIIVSNSTPEMILIMWILIEKPLNRILLSIFRNVMNANRLTNEKPSPLSGSTVFWAQFTIILIEWRCHTKGKAISFIKKNWFQSKRFDFIQKLLLWMDSFGGYLPLSLQFNFIWSVCELCIPFRSYGHRYALCSFGNIIKMKMK